MIEFIFSAGTVALPVWSYSLDFGHDRREMDIGELDMGTFVELMIVGLYSD